MLPNFCLLRMCSADGRNRLAIKFILTIFLNYISSIVGFTAKHGDDARKNDCVWGYDVKDDPYLVCNYMVLRVILASKYFLTSELTDFPCFQASLVTPLLVNQGHH